MTQDDLPEFKKGQTSLSADDLNKIVRAIRPMMLPGSYYNAQMILQRRQGGGGGETNNFTKFAVVTQTAGAASYSGEGEEFQVSKSGAAGKCLLLDGGTGAVEEIEEGEDAEVEFYSIHKVKCKVNKLIQLHSNAPIEPGDSNPDAIVWGTLVNVTDYLEELAGFASEKILFVPTEASNGDGIKWAGKKCDD
jgi:hypothetical protein